ARHEILARRRALVDEAAPAGERPAARPQADPRRQARGERDVAGLDVGEDARHEERELRHGGDATQSPMTFIGFHARSGIPALNAVSAALDADRRTAGTDVVFARTREEVARAIAEREAPIVGWSFYSPDFPRAREDLAWVKEHAAGALHVAGGVHATAE